MYIGDIYKNQHKKSTVIGWSTITALIDIIITIITNGRCKYFFASRLFFGLKLKLSDFVIED